MFRGKLATALFLVFLPILPFLVKVAARGGLYESNPPSSENSVTEYRTQLLMALDLLVRAERVVRWESGSFTKSLGRVPDVLGSLAHYYRIDIMQASRDRLRVLAVGDAKKNSLPAASVLMGDRVLVDDRFQIQSNFTVPTPPRDYLHVLARVVMNQIAGVQFSLPERGALDLMEGVFRGYFRYELRSLSRPDSDTSRVQTLVAVGLKEPVLGEVIEMQDSREERADLYSWVYKYRHTSWVENELRGQLEKIYLAERIHQLHTGSYAEHFNRLLPFWNDLAGLSAEHSPLVVQEFHLDPVFGFHAEVTQRHDQGVNSSEHRDARAWTVNGYGQISELSSVEGVMRQFEQARRRIALHGKALNYEDVIEEPLQQTSSKEGSKKPLLIDLIENDK